MANFNYLVRTKEGDSLSGEIEAESEKSAIETLRKEGTLVLALSTKKDRLHGGFNILQRVGLRDKIIFTQQLAVMIKSGLPIVEALETLHEQTQNQYFKRTILEIAAKVKGGTLLSTALDRYPNIFPRLYINVVRSGEKSGKLDEVLSKMAEQMIADYELISKVRGAMIYPSVILTALVVVIILVLIFVIPQLKKIFEEVEVPLPILTRILLAVSEFIKNFIVFILIFVVLLIFLLRRWARTPSGNLAWDKFKISIPLLGPFLKKVYIARFARTMSTLIKAGLPMIEILETVGGVINNRVFEKSLDKAAKAVETGHSLSSILKKEENFPPLVANLISIGEKSGNVDYVLTTLADFYDKDIENTTRNLASLIEPILMIVLGIGVGLVLAAVLMPIYNLVNVL